MPTIHPAYLLRRAIDKKLAWRDLQAIESKILALNLVRHFAAAAPETRFILLTSGPADQELSVLDAPNVQRFRVDAPAAQRPAAENAELLAAGLLRRVLPAEGLDRVAALYRKVNRRQRAPALLRRLGADLLFSPFMTPDFDDGSTSFVSIVHDLQHRYLPQNFDPRLRDQLDRRLQHIIDRAARIICLSAALDPRRAGPLCRSGLPGTKAGRPGCCH